MSWLSLVTAAHATDVDSYEPASSFVEGLGSLQAESAAVPDETGITAGVQLAWAKDPVVQEYSDGSVRDVVSDQVPLSIAVNGDLLGRVRVSLLLPVYPYVEVPQDVGDIGHGGAGDLRLGAAVPLWEDPKGTHTLGVVPRIGLPTGTDSLRVSNGFSGELLAAFSGRQTEYGYAANLGIRGTPSQPLPGSDQANGSTVSATGSIWWIPSEAVRLGTELDFDRALGGAETDGEGIGMIHAFGQGFLENGFGVNAGFGSSLIQKAGAPPMRVFLGVSFVGLDKDDDDDRVANDEDQCPSEVEDRDGFRDDDGCPDPDNDDDGVVDPNDQCADSKEDLDGWEDGDGCADGDNDRDGVADGEDQCPIEGGPAPAHGCPDADGDTVADATDLCPNLPGGPNGCPDTDNDRVTDERDECKEQPIPAWVDAATSDGCPPQPALYGAGALVKLDSAIQFEKGTATLTASSTPALEQLARILRQNPQVTRVQVTAFVDNVGDDTANKALTAQQAAVVVDWLVVHDVARGRLEAVGAGETMPKFSNRTEDGRSKNRRVEVKVAEATDPGAGWGAVRPSPGPAPLPAPGVVRPGSPPAVPKPAPVVVPP